jgi:hypothetical protein
MFKYSPIITTMQILCVIVANLLYVLIYYILDNLIWLYFPLTLIEKSNRPIVCHVIRLPMRCKQGELKVSRHMHFE